MDHSPTHPDRQGPPADQLALIRLAWFIGLALVLALVGPQPLFAATFSAFLGVGAMAVSLSAMLLREPMWPPQLTRWDVAAALYLLGDLFGWLVDHDAVRQYLQSQGFAG
jgi:hypothetical protein